MDSATEFLFGQDVGSLSAGLPYPSGSKAGNAIVAADHPSNVFVRAFVKGQELIARRSRAGTVWPLLEFWENKVTPHRRVMEEVVQPLLDDAFARKKKRKEDIGEALDDKEVTSLLDDLVKDTDGNGLDISLLVLLIAGTFRHTGNHRRASKYSRCFERYGQLNTTSHIRSNNIV